MKKCYEITVQTQLGRRNGLLILDIVQDQIEGSFHFLSRTMPLIGSIDPEGKIELSGTFITRLKTHTYHACGMIQKTAISLIMHEAKHCYKAEGKEITEVYDELY